MEASAEVPLGSQLLTAVAKQVDGFNHVVVKDKAGCSVHWIPNGERVQIRAEMDDEYLVYHGDAKGFVQKTNFVDIMPQQDSHIEGGCVCTFLQNLCLKP